MDEETSHAPPTEWHQREKGGMSGVKGPLSRKQKEDEDVSDSVEEGKRNRLQREREGERGEGEDGG